VEDSVQIRDPFAVGSAEVVITQPWLPCNKLGIRFESAELVKRFLASRRTGFYLAVIREGNVGAGDKMVMTTANQAQFLSLGSCDYTSPETTALRTLLTCAEPWRLLLCLTVGKSISASDLRAPALETKKC